MNKFILSSMLNEISKKLEDSYYIINTSKVNTKDTKHIYRITKKLYTPLSLDAREFTKDIHNKMLNKWIDIFKMFNYRMLYMYHRRDLDIVNICVATFKKYINPYLLENLYTDTNFDFFLAQKIQKEIMGGELVIDDSTSDMNDLIYYFTNKGKKWNRFDVQDDYIELEGNKSHSYPNNFAVSEKGECESSENAAWIGLFINGGDVYRRNLSIEITQSDDKMMTELVSYVCVFNENLSHLPAKCNRVVWLRGSYYPENNAKKNKIEKIYINDNFKGCPYIGMEAINF